MPVVRLAADFVDKIHDELVEMYFPGVEPVSARDHRDRGALEAALGAPFAIAFGEEAFPSMEEKAARLFYGIAANHPFSNGNKRTALIAADLFCYANSLNLALSWRSSVQAARLAASHNARAIAYCDAYARILRVFSKNMDTFAEIKTVDPEFYAHCVRIRRWVRMAQRG